MLVLSKEVVLIAQPDNVTYINTPGIAVTRHGFIISDVSQAQADLWERVVDENGYLFRTDTVVVSRTDAPPHVVGAIQHLYPAYYVTEENGCVSFFILRISKDAAIAKIISVNIIAGSSSTRNLINGALFVESDLRKIVAKAQPYITELRNRYWICHFTLEPDSFRCTREVYCWTKGESHLVTNEHYLRMNNVESKE